MQLLVKIYIPIYLSHTYKLFISASTQQFEFLILIGFIEGSEFE